MNDKKTSAYRRIVSSTAIFGSAQILNILVNIIRGKLVAYILHSAGMGISPRQMVRAYDFSFGGCILHSADQASVCEFPDYSCCYSPFAVLFAQKPGDESSNRKREKLLADFGRSSAGLDVSRFVPYRMASNKTPCFLTVFRMERSTANPGCCSSGYSGRGSVLICTSAGSRKLYFHTRENYIR